MADLPLRLVHYLNQFENGWREAQQRGCVGS